MLTCQRYTARSGIMALASVRKHTLATMSDSVQKYLYRLQIIKPCNATIDQPTVPVQHVNAISKKTLLQASGSFPVSIC